MDILAAASLCRLIVGVVLLIWGLEYLSIRRNFSDGHILSGEVGRLRYSWSAAEPWERVTGLLFSPGGAVALTAFPSTMGMALLIPGQSEAAYAAYFGLAALAVGAWFLRTPQGQDGSDQMLFLILISLSVAFAINTPAAYWTCGVFLSLQLTVCYLTAGITKLLSAEWRSGAAITLVFRTNIYGMRAVFSLASRYRSVPVAVAWVVIGFECLFPAVFLIPPSLGEALLLIPLTFHLGTALLMGLNLFFLVFFAAYPFLWTVIEQEPVNILFSLMRA